MKNRDITVIINAFNEERHILSCIKSAQLLTQNIILVDMESKDNTVSIAKTLGAAVYIFPFSYYVEPAREFGIKKARTDWVFILDADERITKQLAQETKQVIRIGGFTHYKIPRKNIFGHTWLRYGGWWPDYQTRLLNKTYLKSWPKEIHSTPVVLGVCGKYFTTPLLHYFHGNFETMVEKTIIFEDIESDLLYKTNHGVTITTFFRKFLGELYRRLIRRFGFLDGEVGIIESIYQAFSKTTTYLYLYEKKKRKSSSVRSIP